MTAPTPITYRFLTPSAHTATVFKNAELTAAEFDNNFKGVDDDKVDVVTLDKIFEEILEQKKEEK